MYCFEVLLSFLLYSLVLTVLIWVLLAVLQISAGFQQVKLGERGGRRRDFHDTGINTRQAMEHVKDSKAGQLFSIEIFLTHLFSF